MVSYEQSQKGAVRPSLQPEMSPCSKAQLLLHLPLWLMGLMLLYILLFFAAEKSFKSLSK